MKKCFPLKSEAFEISCFLFTIWNSLEVFRAKMIVSGCVFDLKMQYNLKPLTNLVFYVKILSYRSVREIDCCGYWKAKGTWVDRNLSFPKTYHFQKYHLPNLVITGISKCCLLGTWQFKHFTCMNLILTTSNKYSCFYIYGWARDTKHVIQT